MAETWSIEVYLASCDGQSAWCKIGRANRYACSCTKQTVSRKVLCSSPVRNHLTYECIEMYCSKQPVRHRQLYLAINICFAAPPPILSSHSSVTWSWATRREPLGADWRQSSCRISDPIVTSKVQMVTGRQRWVAFDVIEYFAASLERTSTNWPSLAIDALSNEQQDRSKKGRVGKIDSGCGA